MAKKAADFTVVDTVPSTQMIYIPPGHLTASNPFVLEAEHIIRKAGEGADELNAIGECIKCLGTHAAPAAEGRDG